jgi:hypothetical protein
MSGGLPVTISFLDKRNNTRAQFNRMRPAHAASPSMGNGITNQPIWETESEKTQHALV